MSRSTEFLYEPHPLDLSRYGMHKGNSVAFKAMTHDRQQPQSRRETFVRAAMHHEIEASGIKRNMRTRQAEKLHIPKLSTITYAGMNLN